MVFFCFQIWNFVGNSKFSWDLFCCQMLPAFCICNIYAMFSWEDFSHACGMWYISLKARPGRKVCYKVLCIKQSFFWISTKGLAESDQGGWLYNKVTKPSVALWSNAFSQLDWYKQTERRADEKKKKEERLRKHGIEGRHWDKDKWKWGDWQPQLIYRQHAW